MSSVTDPFFDLLDLIDRIVRIICIIAGTIMTVVVILQVFSRYLPTPTPRWTEELARYLMIFIAFIGASSGIKRWNNIYVDFFINRLPPKVHQMLMFIIQLVVFIFIGFICYLSIRVFPVVGQRQISATLNIPMIIPQSSIITGTFLMLLQLIGVMIKTVRGVKNYD